MDKFYKELEKLIEGANFWKLCGLKVVWGLTSRKFLSVIIALILLCSKVIEANTFLIVLGAYAGLNVLEGLVKKN